MTRLDSDLSPWAALADRLDPPTPTSERATPVTLAAHCDEAYRVRAHLTIIGQEFAGLERGDFDRLMINTPPQVGKSVSAVEWAAFWWLVLHPQTRIVVGSYGDDLALTRGRAVRKLVRLHGAPYGLHVERGYDAVKDWRVTAGGGMRSVGLGSGTAGHPADVIFIDDPVASRADADSLRKRDSTHDWYSADIVSRLSPGGKIIIIQTPWHIDDLRARVLRDEGDLSNGGRWRTVVMPALCSDPATDPLGRDEGAPLPHPKVDVGDTAKLLKHWEDKRATNILRDWISLYQCDPKPREGSLLSWTMLRERRCFQAGAAACSTATRIAVAVDPSGGGRDTAGIVGGYLGEDGRLHISHDRSGVMSSDLWSRAACELAADIGADRIIFESNYGGDLPKLAIRTAWDALRREDPQRFGAFVPFIEGVSARRGKLLRAEPIAQQWIENRVVTSAYLPDLESEWATWLPTDTSSPGRIDASVYLAFALLPIPTSGESTTGAAQMMASANLLTWGGGGR